MVLKNKGNKILIIDDEKHIAEGIKINLIREGHDALVARNGLEGLNYWKEFKPDLIIVDLMMPEIDGIGVIKEIRKIDQELPLLVISAKDQTHEKVKTFKLGVDDYLSKPFDLDEFLLRVDRLLTRSQWNKKESKNVEAIEVLTELDSYNFGENFIDLKNLSATTKNEKIELTLNEVKILKVFFLSPNIALTRDEILNSALGYDKGVTSRTLDNFIVRFRKYFEEDPKNPQFFKSVRSVGYIFDIDRESSVN